MVPTTFFRLNFSFYSFHFRFKPHLKRNRSKKYQLDIFSKFLIESPKKCFAVVTQFAPSDFGRISIFMVREGGAFACDIIRTKGSKIRYSRGYITHGQTKTGLTVASFKQSKHTHTNRKYLNSIFFKYKCF